MDIEARKIDLQEMQIRINQLEEEIDRIGKVCGEYRFLLFHEVLKTQRLEKNLSQIKEEYQNMKIILDHKLSQIARGVPYQE